MVRGTLLSAIRLRQKSTISTEVALCPGRSVTAAATSSPKTSCGMPTTAACCTAGWRWSAVSISSGVML